MKDKFVKNKSNVQFVKKSNLQFIKNKSKIQFIENNQKFNLVNRQDSENITSKCFWILSKNTRENGENGKRWRFIPFLNRLNIDRVP